MAPSGGLLQTCNDTSSVEFRSPKRFKPSPPEEDDDDDRDVSVWGRQGREIGKRGEREVGRDRSRERLIGKVDTRYMLADFTSA